MCSQWIMIKSNQITLGQAGIVHYLDEVCQWDVFVTSSCGQAVSFNRLMLASVSNMFRLVLLDLCSSNSEDVSSQAHISTNFTVQELQYLHDLCHYGSVKMGSVNLTEYTSFHHNSLNLYA